MIYFDSGATTLEKPRAVRCAMARAVNTMSSPGRGSHQATQLAEETDYACRAAAAKLFGVEDESNVVFTSNATHGLNIAIHTLVQPGSRVVISGYEHNAVTRPLHAIPNVTLTVLNTLPFQPERMIEELKTALAQGVDVVICNHVSNVFGCVQPVGEMAALCAEAGVPFVLDASQSAGILPVRMDELHAAFIAMPGHKGLYGPQGTGLLLCNHPVTPLLHGGTGSLSKLQTMPDMLPDRLERHPQHARHRGAAGGYPVRAAYRRGDHRRPRAPPDGTGGGAAAVYGGDPPVLVRGLPPSDRRAVLCGGGNGLRGAGRSHGAAGRGAAGRFALRAAGPPHSGNVENRNGAVQPVGLQHIGSGGAVRTDIAEYPS